MILSFTFITYLFYRIFDELSILYCRIVMGRK